MTDMATNYIAQCLERCSKSPKASHLFDAALKRLFSVASFGSSPAEKRMRICQKVFLCPFRLHSNMLKPMRLSSSRRLKSPYCMLNWTVMLSKQGLLWPGDSKPFIMQNTFTGTWWIQVCQNMPLIHESMESSESLKDGAMNTSWEGFKSAFAVDFPFP